MGVERRGRKSALHLSMVKPKPPVPKPSPQQPQQGWKQPPDEAAIQSKIVDAMPDGHFPPACAPLLRCLSAHIANHDFLAAELVTIHDKDPKTLEMLTKMQVKQSRAIADLSTKLKLTPRSRYSQEKASTRQALNSTTRPWDIKR